MKKLMLVASLCIAAFVVAPIASASAAETLTGSCAVKGTATFSKAKLENTTNLVGYGFEGEATCVEAGTGLVQKGTVTITEGEGEFSCLGLGKETKEGKGVLEIAGKKFEFKLKIKAVGGSVALEVFVEGKLSATGTANFYASLNEEASKCAVEGVTKLEFNASASGTI
jgi:hypothetical protein